MACKQQVVEWSKYRGPNANGKTNYENWDPELLDSSRIIWNAIVGRGHSGISIANGKCYLSGWSKDVIDTDTIEKTTIYCLNALTGEELWTYQFKSPFTEWEGPRSTPVIDENKVYTLSWEGRLFCLDANVGNLLWEKDIYADSLGKRNFWGFSTSAVIYQNMLLLNIGMSGLALDKNSGDVIWKSDKEGFGFASPFIFKYNEKDVAVFTADSSRSIVDILTGEVLMKHKNKHYATDVGLYENKLHFGNEVIDISDEEPVSVWKNDSIYCGFMAGIVSDRYIYQFGGRKKSLYCIDMNTGDIAWNQKFKEVKRYGTVIGVNDKLVILLQRGTLIIAEKNPMEYKEIKRLKVLDAKAKDGLCYIIPTFTDGKIYIRNYGGSVACIDLKI